MKKNFFKKLSFVLALAMIISMIAPAGAALAAAKPKLNATKKYLHLDKDGYDEFDFNIANKKDGWKYKWTSADKKVATVNSKNGLVEATGVGKTKITVVITDKAGKQQAKLSATVIVRDNIASLKITNTPDGDKLAVGKENDFNRSYVTVSGSSKKTSGITRWTVTPSDGATISDSGVFVATKAGEYKITARAFQSKAKYNSWLSDNAKYEKYVTATAEYTVKVAASLTEVKQTNLATFKMTFDTAMTADDVKKNTTVYYMVGDVKVKEQLIKEVKEVDGTDKKEFTVQMTDEFTPAYKYVVEYTDLGEKEFVAATTKLEDVKGIKITTTEATIYEATEVKYDLLNADGVAINKPNDVANLNLRVTLESSNDLVSVNDGKVYMYKLNDTTTIKAKFHTYEYDKSGVETVYEDTKVITCVDKTKDLGKSLLAWTIVGTADKPDYDNAKQFLALEDSKRVFVKIKKVDDNDTESSKADDADKFKFKSSNSSILFVDNAGFLYPLKEGKVTITVEYNDAYVGSFELTVNPKRFVARIDVDQTYITLSNSIKFTDWKKVTVKIKDQYGDDWKNNNFTVDSLSKANVQPTKSEGSDYVRFEDNNAPKGTYTFKISANDKSEVAKTISVNVVAPSSDAIDRYVVEINGKATDTPDVKIKDDHIEENVDIRVFGIASNDVKVEEIALYDNGYTVNLYDPDNKKITLNASNLLNDADNEDDYQLITTTGVAATVSGASTQLVKAKTGRYKVEVIENAKSRTVATTTFIVKDTQATPTLEKVNTFWTEGAAGLFDVMQKSFVIKVNGSTLVDEKNRKIVSVDCTTPDAARKILVREIVVYELVEAKDGTTYAVYHTFKPNYYITLPVDFQF
ncbi:Ig-like domain-containing protein [Lachnospiraceae bacterium MD1]|uniref:Ig-like domain-containing protein n=1 Tax=Variimorphobacter saccharofermentans TaxID=2755051 RepID=A0A839JWA4_9FIRM|nr:Ig-like domain-containing protein [Variimorphobacter saccharofermentans]MBB2181955.1 Ig-like domain-containing protein [Variimorphobacter saccharofermentans]